jgi:flagella basal body P-ring formation protein FlgA
MFLFPRLTLLALCLSAPAYASINTAQDSEQRLRIKIEELLKKRGGQGEQNGVVQVATILTPAKQLAAICPNPELSLAGNDPRLTGKRSIVAQCESRRHFVQIQVSARGTWWVAKNNLAAGSVIQPGDIEPHTGSVERQPAGLIFNPGQIIGQTLTRAVASGQPVRSNQLRQQWRLKAGQQVEVIAAGDGFSVRSQGKALSNAAVNDTLKVQTRSGQTVSGRVNADGQVLLSLQ